MLLQRERGRNSGGERMIRYVKAFGLLFIAICIMALGVGSHNIVGLTLGLISAPMFLGLTLGRVLK